jgi:hypothetical protein
MITSAFAGASFSISASGRIFHHQHVADRFLLGLMVGGDALCHYRTI